VLYFHTYCTPAPRKESSPATVILAEPDIKTACKKISLPIHGKKINKTGFWNIRIAICHDHLLLYCSRFLRFLRLSA